MFDAEKFESEDLHGDFTQWTLHDCDWFHRHLGWNFHIDTDKGKITAIIPIVL